VTTWDWAPLSLHDRYRYWTPVPPLTVDAAAIVCVLVHCHE
jgi:hypothetical protein